jgi:group I intron endonuclease
MDLPAYIYLIKCSANGRLYVGRSAKPEQRWQSHLYALRKGRHEVYLMQNDFNTYGEKCFSFMPVAKINTYDERVLEKDLMRFMETFDPNKGYNYSDMVFERNMSHQERMESIEQKYGIDKKLLFRDAS